MLFERQSFFAGAAVVVIIAVMGACGGSDEVTTATTTTTTTVGTSTTAGASSTVSPTTTNAPPSSAIDAGTPTTTAATAPPSSDEVTVTADDSGTTIDMDPGDVVHIELENCATCGYEWRETTAPDPAVLTLVEHHLDHPDRSGGMTGGYETAVFTYRAKGSGTAKVDLAYHSPSGTAEDTFTLNVNVG